MASHFTFPKSSADFPTMDPIFRYQFYRPLRVRNPRLPYKGYIRALQLYGREENFGGRGLETKQRFAEWAKNNAKVLEVYRQRAVKDGYSPFHGYSDFGNSTYYQSEEDFHTRTSRLFLRQETGPHHRNERDRPVSIRINTPTPGDTQDPDTPLSLRHLSGALILDKDNAELSAVGSAEIAFSLGRVLEDVVEGKDINIEEAREVLKFLGGSKKLLETVEFFREQVNLGQDASIGRETKVHQGTDLAESEQLPDRLASDKNPFAVTTSTPPYAEHKATGFGQSFRELTNGKGNPDMPRANSPVVSNNPIILKTPVQHGDMTHFAYMLYAKNQVMVLFNPAVANDIGTFFAGCRTIIHEDISLREAVKFLGIDPDFVAEFDLAMHTIMLEDPGVAKLIEDSRKLQLFRDHKATNELYATTCQKMEEIGWDRDVSRTCHTKRHLESEDPADRFVMARPIPKQATVQGQAWGVKTRSRTTENHIFELPQTLDAIVLENKPWDQYGASPPTHAIIKDGFSLIHSGVSIAL